MIYKDFIYFSAASVKRCFRFFRVFFLLALCGLISARAQAQPTHPTSARKQIYAAVQQRVAQTIRQEARQRQWPKYQAKMNLFIPAEVAQYAVCRQALKVALRSGERVDLSRLRVDVRCDDAQRWETTITVKPDIYLPVVVASTALDRGQVITPESVTLKTVNISSTRGEYLTRPDEVMGMTVKRRIRERQTVTLHQLESPLLVERGQRVLMIAEQNGVEARAMGEAMKKGRKGEVIKVKNASSGRVVSAMVSASGVVTIMQAGGV